MVRDSTYSFGIKRKAKIFFVIFFAISLQACHGHTPEKKNNGEVKPVTDTIPRPKPPSSFQDSIFINQRAAVFFKLDSLQLIKYKAQVSDQFFRSDEHDCFFQQRYSRNALKEHWKDVNIVDAFNRRYLVFEKADKTRKVIDLDKTPDICGIYLFDGHKEPELIEMTNFDTFVYFYFKKQ